MSPTRRTAVINLAATARSAAEWLLDIAGDPRPPEVLAIAANRHAIALRQAAEAALEAGDDGDDGDARDDAAGRTVPRAGTVEACHAPSPRPGVSCIDEAGHEGPHRNGPDRWHTITEEAPRPFRVVEVADLATRADLAEALAGAASLAYVLGLERRIDRLAALPIADDIEHVRATLAARLAAEESTRADLEGVVAKIFDSTRTLSDRIDRLARRLDEHVARGADIVARTAAGEVAIAYEEHEGDHERAAHPHSLMRPDLPGRVRSLEARVEVLTADLARYAEAPVTSARRGTALEHRARLLEDRLTSVEARLTDLAHAVGDRLSAVENLTTTVVGFTNPEEDDPQRVRLMMDSNAGPDSPRRGRWRDR